MDNQHKEDFSAEQSLRLISSMIETTKNTINDSSHYFLLWGWGILAACIAQYVLKVELKYPNNGIVWLITPVILIIHIILVFRSRNKNNVRTFINDANSFLWTGLGLAYFVLAFVFAKIGWEYCTPFYIILYAVGTYVSGRLIQFKPLFIGGLICFPLAVVTAYLNPDQQIIMLALAILVSYIIPGHLLRMRHKKIQAHV